MLWIFFIGLVLFIMLAIIGTIILKIELRKEYKINLQKNYNPKEYSFFQRRKKKRAFKKVFKQFNKDYIKHYDYILLKYKNIFNSYPQYITSSFLNEYISKRNRYKNNRIHSKALEKIYICLENLYKIKSIIEYFNNHISNAEKTLKEIDKEDYKYYYPELYHKRKNELLLIIYHANKIVKYLELERVPEYERAILELEKFKKPTILEKAGTFALNVLTAPVRHLINVIDGIEEDDKTKVGKGLTFLILGGIGIGLVGDALDAFEGLENLGGQSHIAVPNMDISSIGIEATDSSNIHFVEPHEVSGYVTQDGTVVEGYFRDGDGDTSIDMTVSEGGGYFSS